MDRLRRIRVATGANGGLGDKMTVTLELRPDTEEAAKAAAEAKGVAVEEYLGSFLE